MTPTDKTPRVSDETVTQWCDASEGKQVTVPVKFPEAFYDLALSRARVAELERQITDIAMGNDIKAANARAESAERSAREAIAEARRDVDSANLALAAMEAELVQTRISAQIVLDRHPAGSLSETPNDPDIWGINRMRAALSRPVSSTEALRAVVTNADAEGFKAGMLAQQFVTGTYGVTEDQLEPDHVRVSRAIGGEQ